MTAATVRITDADGRIDNPRAIRDGFEAEVSVRPLRLHTAMVEGALGGHAFSADFARYLAKVKPRLVRVWEQRIHQWWVTPYGRERVKRGFTSRYGAERGAERYLVALCRASGYQHARAQALEARHSAFWCDEQTRIAQRLAK